VHVSKKIRRNFVNFGDGQNFFNSKIENPISVISVEYPSIKLDPPHGNARGDLVIAGPLSVVTTSLSPYIT